MMAFIDASFVAASGWSSRAIEWWGAGGFSHVDCVLPDAYCKQQRIPLGSLLGARSDLTGGKPAGVQIRPPTYETWAKRLVLRVPCTEEQAGAWLGFLLAQVGKSYDKVGIFAFIIGRNWREEDSWWCSELFVRSLEVAGICGELAVPFYKITPGDGALVASALGGQPVLKIGI
jgi:hypothetical protein